MLRDLRSLSRRNFRSKMENDNFDVKENIESSTIQGDDSQNENIDSQNQQPVEDEHTSENKRDANSRIRQLVAERNSLKQQLQNPALFDNSRIPDEISPDDYRAMQINSSQTAIEVQNLKTQNAYRDLKTDAAIISSTIPELNPNSPQYNKDLDDLLASQYEETCLILDENNKFVGTRKPLADFMQENVEKMRKLLSRTTTNLNNQQNQVNDENVISSSVNNEKATSEPDFESMTSKEIEAYLKSRR